MTTQKDTKEGFWTRKKTINIAVFSIFITIFLLIFIAPLGMFLVGFPKVEYAWSGHYDNFYYYDANKMPVTPEVNGVHGLQHLRRQAVLVLIIQFR